MGMLGVGDGVRGIVLTLFKGGNLSSHESLPRTSQSIPTPGKTLELPRTGLEKTQLEGNSRTLIATCR